jgi:hypothetical protein
MEVLPNEVLHKIFHYALYNADINQYVYLLSINWRLNNIVRCITNVESNKENITPLFFIVKKFKSKTKLINDNVTMDIMYDNYMFNFYQMLPYMYIESYIKYIPSVRHRYGSEIIFKTEGVPLTSLTYKKVDILSIRISYTDVNRTVTITETNDSGVKEYRAKALAWIDIYSKQLYNILGFGVDTASPCRK